MKKLYLIFGTYLISAVSSLAMAEEATTAVATSDNVKVFAALAAGFGIAIAAAFGALGQGKATAAALDGIARNPNAAPKMFTPMIIGLALIETLVIYTLVIAFMLIGKI
ncbi:MAG: F0F1 ATP synthase subunit C [Deltaproteobacteria bacterium]|nr:F0F1 ATP synthase subunit C [Deltaproteobacteria bacterium]